MSHVPVTTWLVQTRHWQGVFFFFGSSFLKRGKGIIASTGQTYWQDADGRASRRSLVGGPRFHMHRFCYRWLYCCYIIICVLWLHTRLVVTCSCLVPCVSPISSLSLCFVPPPPVHLPPLRVTAPIHPRSRASARPPLPLPLPRSRRRRQSGHDVVSCHAAAAVVPPPPHRTTASCHLVTHSPEVRCRVIRGGGGQQASGE